ncbi:response regulator [Sphingomonas morindae]|uniref:Response regulator n=1 Tax=Sphingomonas morindae TaxID=1541170 RepID=A0ABY4X587_9SPHN|nr:response regulator [Sphingomonas morindae]USI72020.1 response regulator [Sphingomonas morindae]
MPDMHSGMTVLVVEDEPLVRMISADALEEHGFTVIEAATADEAIQLLKTCPDVRFVFSDIRMPGSMDGMDLAHFINSTWPRIGILLTSGDTPVSPEALPDDSRFVPKPYRIEAMLAELDKVIQAKRAHGKGPG